MTSEPSASRDGLIFCPLASGSRGNAIFISDGTTSVLVDAGLSGVEIERRMKARGLAPQELDAVVVSHEHGDHIRGVGVLSRRFHLPVYISPGTETAAGSRMGRLTDVAHFECGTGFSIRTLSLHPFSTSHDAADPAGFTIGRNGTRIGIATDLGVATAMVREHLRACSLVFIEANHDPEMLMNGPYPWHLKQRVKSRTGHLSNFDTRSLVAEIQHDRLSHVVLGHMSEKNNCPRKALSTVGAAFGQCRTRLSLATQEEGGELIRLSGE
ncbi:MBL fold metallo-hydrolase [Desulfonema ishimotonii]|uniref:MBL fold metallo-hydrolase n=1 Tax=Desulfonema ishimotonii TaxID=45657 RepID=A0A401G3L0_9BACT|nr:MBL fold metallo-hydrolase [Desulfonema ishimotonii]GBC63828.1 MBL fold metallo-hydrolase [Desulfonema ishimotonii]